MEKSKFYECAKCGKLHYVLWSGDCNEHHRSFDKVELDEAYKPLGGWEKVGDPFAVAK